MIAVPPVAEEYQVGVPALAITKLETAALSDTKKDCALATGATGVAGCVLIGIFVVLDETHPLASVTV